MQSVTAIAEQLNLGDLGGDQQRQRGRGGSRGRDRGRSGYQGGGPFPASNDQYESWGRGSGQAGIGNRGDSMRGGAPHERGGRGTGQRGRGMRVEDAEPKDGPPHYPSSTPYFEDHGHESGRGGRRGGQAGRSNRGRSTGRGGGRGWSGRGVPAEDAEQQGPPPAYPPHSAGSVHHEPMQVGRDGGPAGRGNRGASMRGGAPHERGSRGTGLRGRGMRVEDAEPKDGPPHYPSSASYFEGHGHESGRGGRGGGQAGRSNRGRSTERGGGRAGRSGRETQGLAEDAGADEKADGSPSPYPPSSDYHPYPPYPPYPAYCGAPPPPSSHHSYPPHPAYPGAPPPPPPPPSSPFAYPPHPAHPGAPPPPPPSSHYPYPPHPAYPGAQPPPPPRASSSHPLAGNASMGEQSMGSKSSAEGGSTPGSSIYYSAKQEKLDQQEKKIQYYEEKERRRIIAEKRQKNLEMQLEASKKADFCYLVDITQSQQEVVDMLGTRIHGFAAKLRWQYRSLQLRIAFVGYRDHDLPVDQRITVIPFTEDLDGFKQRLAGVFATGGADEPEDVFGGLEAAGQLDWDASLDTCRQLIHIADAPCHGSEYHSLLDDYPSGDPQQRDLAALLDKLQNEKQVSGYHFSHVFPQATEKMVSQFRASCKDGNEWITEDDNFADIEQMASSVSSVMRDSLAANIQRATASVSADASGSHQAQQQQRRERVPVNGATPDWRSIEREKARVIKFKVPHDMKSLLDVIEQGRPERYLLERTSEDIPIQVAPQPFSQGGLRLAYRGRLELQSPPRMADMVFKEFISTQSEDNKEPKYRVQAALQAVAGRLALLFNEAVKDQGIPVVKFAETSIVSYHERLPDGTTRPRHFTSEFALKGDWMKWMDNTHKKKSYKDGSLEVLEAFCHWTYEASDRTLMVMDLQGLKLRDGSLLLTDPALHHRDMSMFGDTNLGYQGQLSFMQNHHCNGICKKLKLRPGLGEPPPDPLDKPVLLQAGQAHSLPDSVHRLTVEDRWRFVGDRGVQYLDASALVFDDNSKYLGVVDYQNRSPPLFSNSMKHSGDKTDQEKGTGLHIIDINLDSLPEGVKDIFLTISGWRGKTLDMLRQPFIRIKNPDKNGRLLCQYNLGSTHSKEELAKYRSAIMCRVSRAPAGWVVYGMGKLGQGAAGEYNPLVVSCQSVLLN
ncbi:hypothetical protein DUNSADRAFT_13448 [Dunaliella salina]|uniref:Alpha-type protein kinase domain-containing protein n=1 Tax=Dunaliella salina TaxID=3046 RepID=A0ABQ7G9B7_DUNSA|nr:hypothetical protein DUNSADRAFT_13448 [Dunaliella salina]|eukprot:KAF5831211.1 hypothetical protein DUNSADRAFT_13448 [Dunaliella salina]